MHYLQLVDSLVLLDSNPLTIHRLHPRYHQLRASTSLEEALTILASPITTTLYLLPSGSLSADFDPSAIAAFESPQLAAYYYPELLL